MDTALLTSVDIKEIEQECPVCGNHEFSTMPLMRDGKKYFSQTVLWCMKNRGEPNMCRGTLCYCKQCDKFYSSSAFGYRNGAYECKECGTVQWDYTDYKKEEERGEAILRHLRNRY